jgi:hypothetical protein
VLLHVNLQSFFSYAEDGATPLAALSEAVAHLAADLPGARLTVALRNAACAPPDACERARASAERAGAFCVNTLDAAAAAIGVAKRWSAARARATAAAQPRVRESA